MVRGVQYRVRPTSQLRDYGATNLWDDGKGDKEKYGEKSTSPYGPPASGQHGPPLPQGHPASPVNYPSRWETGGPFPIQVPDFQRIVNPTPAPRDLPSPSELYGGAVGRAWSSWQQALAGAGQVDEQAIAAEQAQQEIDRKEMELRQAMLDGDKAKAEQLLGDIKRARAYINQSYKDYNTLVTPHYNEAIANAGQIYEQNQPALYQVQQDEQGAIAKDFSDALLNVSKEGDLIGAGGGAKSQVADSTDELRALFESVSTGRYQDALKILQATETAAVEGNKAFKVEDEFDMRNQQRIEDGGYGQRERGAQESIDDINRRQQLFDLDKQRAAIAHQETLRRLQETGESPYMDAIGFGQLTAENYIYGEMNRAGIPLDRQMMLRQVMDDAWSQGVFDPAEFEKWLNDSNEDGTVKRFQEIARGLSQQEMDILRNAMGAYAQGRNQFASLNMSTDTYKDAGERMYKKGGEAPANIANAADARKGIGEYGARARRVSAIAPEILAGFDVKSLGQWRDTSVKGGGDRSSNSDHYSGGALDFSGSEAEMQRLEKYLESRSDVSFVRIHGNPRHVHVSFKL